MRATWEEALKEPDGRFVCAGLVIVLKQSSLSLPAASRQSERTRLFTGSRTLTHHRACAPWSHSSEENAQTTVQPKRFHVFITQHGPVQSHLRVRETPVWMFGLHWCHKRLVVLITEPGFFLCLSQILHASLWYKDEVVITGILDRDHSNSKTTRQIYMKVFVYVCQDSR